ncbi:hypothetical protein BKA69DRAFT_1110008 [Paraphysoderma sedebokerense]|nr:hypothetical protein BKA69DRAFT_1110008 [Paraphysoderma sedebokerense]
MSWLLPYIFFFVAYFFIKTVIKLRSRLRNAASGQRQDILAAKISTKKKSKSSSQPQPADYIFFGFFHPYCNAGGGGERVLWTAIRSIQNKYKNGFCVVYTGDNDVTESEILTKVQSRFNIQLDESRITFVFLNKRKWIEDKQYPRFTLLGQSLGSMWLGLEAVGKFVPDVFIDSMGYAFTYPLVKFFVGCPIAAYVHYPTISTDMISTVQNRTAQFNNDGQIANNKVLSIGKLIYYKLFALIYGFVGRFADVVMVNSSWTKSHINVIWNSPLKTYAVYPPCDTATLAKYNLDGRKNIIISVAQFRPEKNHQLQLHAFKALLDSHPEYRLLDSKAVYLVLLGSSRNEEDENRIEELKELAIELGIQDQTLFTINAPYSLLQQYLSQSLIGLHTMTNEHFGIGIVEYMAAGLIPVTHDSGGPKMDIVVEGCGYRATTPAAYASAIHDILSSSPSEQRKIQSTARQHVCAKFSEQVFIENWSDCLSVAVDRVRKNK